MSRCRLGPATIAAAVLVVLSLVAQLPAGGAVSSGGPPVHAQTGPPDEPWPAGLPERFEVKPPFKVSVPSFDGVQLQGWIHLPVLPGGVRAPVVLVSSPYYGQTAPTADVEEDITPRFLVERGYAVAGFNVRGTGGSGGCLEFFGPKEQRDQAVLVEWLAAQPWSNGRVGMYGLSYMGTTPWEAAIQRPPHLKTIVVAGMVADAYNFFHTPQGAAFTVGPAFAGEFSTLVSNQPTCRQVQQFSTAVSVGNATDVRDPAFWRPRRLADEFAGVTTSVFLTHGFQDMWGSGHGHQEDHVWNLLPRAPKRMMLGQWGHEFPTLPSWNETLVEWLDFWLKAIGTAPPGLGTVEYQDTGGDWHRATGWPPPSPGEVLYLTEAGLTPEPDRSARTFVSAPLPPSAADESGRLAPLLCTPPSPDPGTPAPALLYTTTPLIRPVRLAGNPFAYLSVVASAPGGLVTVHLVDLGPDFSCQGTVPSGYQLLSYGAADLRFHTGTYLGRNFPTGRRIPVRIDIANLAHVLAPKHRLGVLVSYGDPAERTTQPYAPAVVIRGDGTLQGSHVVLPVDSGTLGGQPPRIQYPPTPFPGRGTQ